MQGLMKTILSALQIWTKKLIKKNTPDWNQNDANGDGYIKNRPFYSTEGDDHVLVDNATVETTSGQPTYNPFAIDEFVEGQTYTGWYC